MSNESKKRAVRERDLLKAKLEKATRALDWILLRSKMEEMPNPYAEKIAAVASEALDQINA